MEDFDALQGLWDRAGHSASGQLGDKSFTKYCTDYEFEGNRVRQILPNSVDAEQWGTFEIDPTTTPKRITIVYELQDINGEIVRTSRKWWYELTGDTLLIGYPFAREQSSRETSENYNLEMSLARYFSVRPTVENAVLGTVNWYEGPHFWETSVELFPNQNVRLQIAAQNKEDTVPIDSGAELIEWLRIHEKSARAYAIRFGFDWKEDANLDEDTMQSYIEPMVLNNINIEADGEVSLWYGSYDMFDASAIGVFLDEPYQFTEVLVFP